MQVANGNHGLLVDGVVFADRANGVYGGVYTFENGAALDAYVVEPFTPSDPEHLRGIIEPGDVLLVAVEDQAHVEVAVDVEADGVAPQVLPGQGEDQDQGGDPAAQRHRVGARIMPDGARKGSFVQAYNVQIAVDSKAQIIVAAEITQELAPGSVELRLRGRDPEFVVVVPAPPAVAEPADDVDDALPVAGAS
mgnify:CR=1 FL=1